MRYFWPEEFIQFLKENYPTHTSKELQKIGKDKFGLNFTAKQIKNKCYYMGLKSLDDGKFKNNNIPHNKGKKHNKETLEKMSKALKALNGKNHPSLPLFSERREERYIYIKVKQPNVWIPKHQYIWIKEHGEIPENHVITFIDGDTNNFDINNLRCVHKTDLATTNLHYSHIDDPELKQVCITLSNLKRVQKKRANHQDS